MTELRVVADNTNVETIPVCNLQDLAGQFRDFADRLDAGEYEDLKRVLLVFDTAPLTFEYWGASLNGFETLGMLEAAKMLVFADNVLDD